jgi:hypothetical protein
MRTLVGVMSAAALATGVSTPVTGNALDAPVSRWLPRCQSKAIPETCPSGEEPPEADPGNERLRRPPGAG